VSRLPSITGRQAIAALRRAGFGVTRIEGSHHHLSKPGRPGVVTVPVHAGDTLGPRTLHSILRQAGLTPDQFAALVK
jgi:predicted RNA binding protein YcfA (HicA-like mRNA interferase family)